MLGDNFAVICIVIISCLGWLYNIHQAREARIRSHYFGTLTEQRLAARNLLKALAFGWAWTLYIPFDIVRFILRVIKEARFGSDD